MTFRDLSAPVSVTVKLPIVAPVSTTVAAPAGKVTGLPTSVAVPLTAIPVTPAGSVMVKVPAPVTTMVLAPATRVIGAPVAVPVPLARVWTPVVTEYRKLI